MRLKAILKISFLLFTFYFILFTCFGQPKLVLPVGHTAKVNSAAFSPDAKLIVTTSDDNTAKVWDVASGKLLYSLDEHQNPVFSAAFSPDGKRIVTVSFDKTAKVWDILSGKLLYSLEEHPRDIHSANFSPDGKKLVTASWKTAKVWNAKNGKFLFSLEGHSKSLGSAIFSPDGNKIVTASDDKTVKIWDAVRGKLLLSLVGHTRFVNSAVFSPDGKRIVSVSKYEGCKVWDAENGKLFFSLDKQTSAIYSAVFSPDGQKIVTASFDSTARVWDATSGELVFNLHGHTATIYSANFSPNGKMILTASYDNTAKIWDAENGKLLHSLMGHTNSLSSAVFSSDGKKIVTASWDNSARIWDASNGDVIFSLAGHTSFINSAVYSQDGKRIIIALGNKTAKVWDVASGKLLHNLEGHKGSIETACFSSDGKRILTASWDRTAKIWDAENGNLLHSLEGHKRKISSALFSPDGKKIVTASDDETVKVWDAESGKLLHNLIEHSNGVNYAFFSPDGKRITTTSKFGQVKIRDLQSGRLLHILEGHKAWVSSAFYSPDGKRLITASRDKTAKVWDASSGKLLFSLDHPNGLCYARFSPDEKKILTASLDKTAKIWDAENATLLKEIYFIGSFHDFNYKDNSLISSNNFMLSFWDMASGNEMLSCFAVDKTDWVVIHPTGLFDASPDAMKLMYFVQKLNIIEFEQLKDRYWEPGLWKKIMDGEELRDVQGFDKALPLFPKVENLAINNGKIEFELVDNGGGIGKYMIYVNDKEVFVGNREGNENIKDGRLMVSYKLEGNQYLKPGNENQIKVKAYNAENYIVSRGATVQYKHKEEKRINPSIFIVSCGVSDYTGDAIDLRYAAKDAEDIHHSLHIGAEKLFGEDKTFQYLLTTNKEKEKWPTKENIKSTFEEIADKAKSIDVIVLYLSGHGINWGGQDGDFYYLTQDAYTASGEAYNDPAIREKSTLSSNELVELFKLVPATKQVLIIDACASGQVVEDLIAQRDISSSTIRALDRMKDRTGMFIITGSAADAVSYEASKYGQGLLTYSLLEGIKGAALREGQFIDIDLLFQRAKDRVPELAEGIGGIQQPQVFFPYGSASFDIGLLEEEDKSKIPLAKEKPVFVMSQFMNSETFADELKLEYLIDEKLRNISAKGSEAELIFYDAKSFPEAYQLKGLYTLSGDEVDLKFNLFLGSEKLHSIEVRGSKTSMEDFVNEIIEKVNEKLD
jgi:WD40 repeat protein